MAKIEKTRPSNLTWIRLDNAAKIYPAIRRLNFAAMFRVSVLLNEPVDMELLDKALQDILPRFPHFKMTMKTGVFWYYLDTIDKMPHVTPDAASPCKRIHKKEDNNFLFRVRCFNRRIALEVFHVLTDGTGALIFLKTLTARYLTLKYGISITPGNGVLDINEQASETEMEDAYSKYARFEATDTRREDKAYQVKGTKEPDGHLNITTGIISADRILQEAKKYKASLTEFVAGIFIKAMIDYQKAERHYKNYPVKLCIPVNLRNFYPSDSLRNFVHYVNIGIDPRYGDFSLEEIIEQLHHQMRLKLGEKFINAAIGKNVSDERKMLIRPVPLFIKNIVMDTVYQFVGESRTSSTISNLGNTDVPQEMKPYIDRFDFIIGGTRLNAHKCTIISYNNIMTINFSRMIKEPFIERAFFRQLIKMGIPVTIESNQ